MELKNIKTVKPNRHLFRKIIALIISLGIIVASYMFISQASEDANNTVSVMRIKSSSGMEGGNMMTVEDVESYDLIRTELQEGMILEEDTDTIIGKYTAYYLRGKSILYTDQFVDEKVKKNEWLYDLDDEGEVLTLPYNYLECGGDILMPGDRVRIRVSYEAEEISEKGNYSSALNPNFPEGSQEENGKEGVIVDVLFDSIEIKDMLNSNSHSIYEVYKEVLKLSEDKRQIVMKSDEFLSSIQPRALLLEGTPEQIDAYAKLKSFDSNNLTITILSRNNNDVILDQLPTIEKEVESWINEEKEK